MQVIFIIYWRLSMAYTISLPTKTYKTLNGEYTITQEKQKTGNLVKTRFNIVATGVTKEKTTDWMNTPLSDPIDIIKKAMPSITDNLPLVESNDKGRTYTCSAYLLKGGKVIRLYLPITDTINRLGHLIEQHDSLQLSDGEHVYSVSYKDIEALIIR